MGQRAADNFRLLVNFFRHEVAVIALVDQQRGCRRAHHGPRNNGAGLIMDLRARMGEHRPIALLQVGDAVRERRQRHRVRPQEHLAIAIAHRERAAAPRADQQVVAAGEYDRERECAIKPAKRRLHRRHGLGAAPKLAVDKLNHRLGVGFALEHRAVALQLLAQLAEVLDNAVVHHAHARRGMGMRVALDGLAVRGPPRVADAAASTERLAGQPALKGGELAFGPAPGQNPALDGGDARGIVAPVFKAPERLDQTGGGRFLA